MKATKLAIFCMALLFAAAPLTVYATSSDDVTSVLDNTMYYDPNYVCTGCCNGTSTAFGPGKLPSYVPAIYNSIFTAAGAKYNVDPAVLVGIFFDEQDGYISAVSDFKAAETNPKDWPTPPAPYGDGPAWAFNNLNNGSGAWPAGSPEAADGAYGARGPFQFEPGTWVEYGVDATGNGTPNALDLTDAAFAAAKYLAALGATQPETYTKVEHAANSYYSNQPGPPYYQYAVAAATIVQLIKTSEGSTPTTAANPSPNGCTPTTTSGTYKNPLRAVQANGSLVAHRIDEGVDYGGHGDVYAIGNAVVSYVGKGIWFGAPDLEPGSNESVVYKLTDGPASGLSVYFAEDCEPKVTEGEAITYNTVICYMDGDNDPWIETGWAVGGAVGNTYPEDMPRAGVCPGPCYDDHPDGSEMAYGLNFSQLLASLGAPAGNANLSTNPGDIIGTLPANWPKW